MSNIGIDLGTSNSAAAVLRGGRPVIIPSAEGLSIGGKAFPSYVAFTADGQMLVGESARRQAAANPEGTVVGFKRRMDRRETIALRGQNYSPEQLSAFLLQKIKRDAEAFLGEPVQKAVVTVPANFDDNQRSATKDACRIAGLEVAQALSDAGITPRDVDRVVFVGGPTRMPAVRAFFEDMFGHQAEMGLDPMECVAAGAAIQAGVLAGIVLVDVTPLTLGVETLGGIATALVTRNTPIPVKHTEVFTTAADMQTNVTVHVFQGERPMASDNTSLGEFTLQGLPPAPRRGAEKDA